MQLLWVGASDAAGQLLNSTQVTYATLIVVDYSLNEIEDVIRGGRIECVLFYVASVAHSESFGRILSTVREWCPQVFICVYGNGIECNPHLRYWCYERGASMATAELRAIEEVIAMLRTEACRQGHYTCPFCHKTNLTEDQLWQHCPLYHINEVNTSRRCPLCNHASKHPFQVHMHNRHGPPGRGDQLSEFKLGETTIYAFALVVCQHPISKRFLLVQVGHNCNATSA